MSKKRPETSLSKPGGRQGFRAGSRAWRGRMTAFSRNESGAVAIITAILMVVLLGFLALAVDVGHLATVKNELQNAADAAAIAGARALVFGDSLTIQGMTPMPDPPYCGQAVDWAHTTINQSDARALSITVVQTGVWNWKTNTFTVDQSCGLNSGVNAVHVEVKRDDSSNPSVATWFARILGVDTVNAGAKATAAVGCVCRLCKWAPIALTEDFRAGKPLSHLDDPYNSSNTIMFYPDQADDGGWCLLTQNPTPPTLTNAITNPSDHGCLDLDSSEVYLNNGNLVPGIRAVQDQVAAAQQDGKDGWIVPVPVVEKNMSDQLNQTATVTGWALIDITGAWTPSDRENPTYNDSPPRFVIQFTLIKDHVLMDGESGAIESTLYAKYPKLVQ
jgi:Flp pilus assembly protein TadG